MEWQACPLSGCSPSRRTHCESKSSGAQIIALAGDAASGRHRQAGAGHGVSLNAFTCGAQIYESWTESAPRRILLAKRDFETDAVLVRFP